MSIHEENYYKDIERTFTKGYTAGYRSGYNDGVQFIINIRYLAEAKLFWQQFCLLFRFIAILMLIPTLPEERLVFVDLN